MRLFYSNTSPYSRKVRLLILEKGLQNKIEGQLCNPFDNVPELRAANPLSKIPTLITDDGFALYDSPVICEYLDSLAPETRLIPQQGKGRWQVLRWEALADGITDAAYGIVMERRRLPNEQSPQAIQNWQAAINSAVIRADRDLDELPSSMTLAQLALGATLGYLDFRLPELDWRNNRNKLAAWYDTFAKRSSMIETSPK